MYHIFLCKLYIQKHFARMLNSSELKFANISENKVLANNSEFTVLKRHHVLDKYSFSIKLVDQI